MKPTIQCGKPSAPVAAPLPMQSLESVLGRIYRRLSSLRRWDDPRVDVPCVDIDAAPKGCADDELDKLRKRMQETERDLSHEAVRIRRRILDITVGRSLQKWRDKFPDGRVTKRRRFLLNSYRVFLLYPQLAFCDDFEKEIAPRVDEVLRVLSLYKSSITHAVIPQFLSRPFPKVLLFGDTSVLTRIVH